MNICTMDAVAWERGYADGMRRNRRCPYSDKRSAWSWSAGWIEGNAFRMRNLGGDSVKGAPAPAQPACP